MPRGEPAPSRYLAEWYTPRTCLPDIADLARRVRQSLAAMPAESQRTQLLYAVEIPQDAYAFGLFAAVSSEAVSHACQEAGVPADRVTAAVEAL